MRLNTGTLLLLGAAILVIILVVVISSQPADDSANATPTAASVSGALTEGVEAGNIARLEVRDHNTGEYVRLVKDTGGAWDIAGTYQSDVTDPDQETINARITEYAGIQFSNSFESSELAAFGLDQPAYTFIVTTDPGNVYRLYVGGQNPAGNRYYVISELGDGDSATTPDTDTATEEVVEATTELTAEASAEATAESTADTTFAALPDVWDLVTEPRPTLSGTKTILLVSDTTLDGFIRLIAAPPYGPTPTPTATATNTPNPFSEVDQTATAESMFATAYAQATATAQALMTEEATAEASAEATAE